MSKIKKFFGKLADKLKAKREKLKEYHKKYYEPIIREKWSKRRLKRFSATTIHVFIQALFGFVTFLFALKARSFEKAGDLGRCFAYMFGGVGVSMGSTFFDSFIAPIIFNVPLTDADIKLAREYASCAKVVQGNIENQNASQKQLGSGEANV